MDDSDAVVETRMQAAEAGRIKYRSSPCRKCGCDIRYTRTGRCTACDRRLSSHYREKINNTVREALARKG